MNWSVFAKVIINILVGSTHFVVHCVYHTDSDCYINDRLVFDVYSVKRMYNVKISTGKNTWCLVKITHMVMMMMLMMVVVKILLCIVTDDDDYVTYIDCDGDHQSYC